VDRWMRGTLTDKHTHALSRRSRPHWTSREMRAEIHSSSVCTDPPVALSNTHAYPDGPRHMFNTHTAAQGHTPPAFTRILNTSFTDGDKST